MRDAALAQQAGLGDRLGTVADDHGEPVFHLEEDRENRKLVVSGRDWPWSKSAIGTCNQDKRGRPIWRQANAMFAARLEKSPQFASNAISIFPCANAGRSVIARDDESGCLAQPEACAPKGSIVVNALGQQPAGHCPAFLDPNERKRGWPCRAPRPWRPACRAPRSIAVTSSRSSASWKAWPHSLAELRRAARFLSSMLRRQWRPSRRRSG